MKNMAMNAAAVYGMCCGIFLSFCMKDPFAGRATCSDSSGLTFIYLSLFYYSLYTYLYNPDRKPSIVSANFDCRLSVRSRTSLFAGEKIFLTVSAGERIFRSILVLGLVANPRAEK